LRLPCSQPYDWHKLLTFFAGRATPGVEKVVGDTYRRTLLIDGRPRIVEIALAKSGEALRIGFADSTAKPDRALAASAARVFDADAPIAQIRAALTGDRTLKRLLRNHPGVRVPGAWDGYELTIRAILGQQISVKAATTIAGRIADRYGEPVKTGDDSLGRLFPTPAKLARARFNKLGLVQSRIDTIRRVSAAVHAGDIRFDGTQTTGDTCEALLGIKGIGDWTTQYVRMRALRDPDAFPSSDLGLISAVEAPERVTPKELALRAERWRPWRAYAAMLLWGSLAGSGG
jgi:AraC family transcriptional regulator of adaptative response / DNA-3-methyladenine glycosylase II